MVRGLTLAATARRGLPVATNRRLLLVVSVAFIVTHHWLLANPDNVRNVSAAHRGPFEASAVALAVVGAVGVFAGYSSSSR